MLLGRAATGRARRILRAMKRRRRAWAAAATWPARPGWPRAACGCRSSLTEADSHLGVANRLLAPFAKRVFLAFDLPEPRGRRSGSSPGGRSPPARAGRPGGRARAVRDRRRARVPARLRRLARRAALNEAAIEAFGGAAPCWVLHACGRRDYAELARRLEELGRPAALQAAPLHRRRSPTRTRPPTWRPRAPAARCSSCWRPACRRARPVSARDRRPPDEERALDGARGRCGRRARRGARRAAARARGGGAARAHRTACTPCGGRRWVWPGRTPPSGSLTKFSCSFASNSRASSLLRRRGLTGYLLKKWVFPSCGGGHQPTHSESSRRSTMHLRLGNFLMSHRVLIVGSLLALWTSITVAVTEFGRVDALDARASEEASEHMTRESTGWAEHLASLASTQDRAHSHRRWCAGPADQAPLARRDRARRSCFPSPRVRCSW